MSELITNLNAIYNAKLAIKQAIGTNSDNIEDYATYISEMGPSVSGYSYITGNGTYNIASYEYVNVNVPGEIPPGYTYVYGSYNITGNGSYTVSSYENVNVNVPVPSGYIIPSGTYNITENGTYNISSYENVNVSVSGGGGTDYTWVDFETKQGPSYDLETGNKIEFNGYSSGEGTLIDSSFIESYPALSDYLGSYLIYITGSKSTGNSTFILFIMCINSSIIPVGGQVIKGKVLNIDNLGDFVIVDEVNPSVYAGGNGTSYITTNGTTDVTKYSYVSVNVSGGGVSLSGDYYMFIPSDGFSASSININSYQPAEVFFQQVSPFVPEDPGMMMYSDYTNINIYSFNNGKDTLLNSSTGWFNNDSIQNTSFTVNSSTDICAYTERFTYVPGEIDPEMGTETPGEYVSQGETLIQVGSSYGSVLNVPSGEHNVWYSYSGIQGIFVLDNWDVSDDFQVPSV